MFQSTFKPIIKNGVMIFKLNKPQFGSRFGIWEKWIRQAKDNKYKIVVMNKEIGTATYPTYKDWIKGAKREKHPHNFPNNPMWFYFKHILPDVNKRDQRKKEERKVDRIVEDWTPQGRLKLFQALKKVLKK